MQLAWICRVALTWEVAKESQGKVDEEISATAGNQEDAERWDCGRAPWLAAAKRHALAWCLVLTEDRDNHEENSVDACHCVDDSFCALFRYECAAMDQSLVGPWVVFMMVFTFCSMRPSRNRRRSNGTIAVDAMTIALLLACKAVGQEKVVRGE